jgi:hypothetical protein
MAAELDVKGAARLLVAAAILASASGTARAELYSSREIRGRVVDAASGAPLEKAVVVAMWLLTPRIGLQHERYSGRLRILETLTSADGSYRFPGWGPMLVSPLSTMDEATPRIGAYAPGYVQSWLYGPKEMEKPGGLEFRLDPVEDDKQRGRQARNFFLRLNAGTGTDALVDWPNYPITTALMIREREWLKARGLEGFAPTTPRPESMTEDEKRRLQRGEREVSR